jgi:hypothetical protein
VVFVVHGQFLQVLREQDSKFGVLAASVVWVGVAGDLLLDLVVLMRQ